MKLLISILFLASSLATVALAEECVITGCNSEICSESAEPHFGICVWKTEFQCYQQFGVCSKATTGECAWEQTEELQQCLEKLKQEQAGSPHLAPREFRQ